MVWALSPDEADRAIDDIYELECLGHILSNRGSLVSFRDRLLFNGHGFYDKEAMKIVRKLEKKALKAKSKSESSKD